MHISKHYTNKTYITEDAENTKCVSDVDKLALEHL